MDSGDFPIVFMSSAISIDALSFLAHQHDTRRIFDAAAFRKRDGHGLMRVRFFNSYKWQWFRILGGNQRHFSVELMVLRFQVFLSQTS